MDQLRWPARLSQISSMRSDGKGSVGACPSHVSHRASGGRSSSERVRIGRLANTSVNSAWSHGWRTTFGALVTPLARRSPVAGRNSVSSLAVPPRTYACG